MKQIKLLGLMLMMAVGSAQLRAETEEQERSFICLPDLNDQVIQDFSQGKMGDRILECAEGASLPFKITVKGQFLALESAATAPLYLKVLKTCYMRCEEKENFLFSADLQTWKNFSEFFTGGVKVSIETEEGRPTAGLQVELNQRN